MVKLNVLENGYMRFIEIVDSLRYLIMYMEGGIYSDLDVHPNMAIRRWFTWHKLNQEQG